MAIKYSTGRGTRMRHSTAMEWEDLEKAKKKYDPLKHSTGEESTLKHATGTEFDYKVLSKRLEISSNPGLHSKPQTEADEYLERFRQSRAGQRSGELEERRGKGK